MASKTKLDNTAIGRHLGKSSAYISSYDPTLLVKEPRQSNRTHLDIKEGDLPFIGFDTWNGYEVTGLTDNGLPVTGICKFVYPCNSKYIVESKSVKLYFNSFSMTKLGSTAEEVLKEIEDRAAKDLSELVESKVEVTMLSNYDALSDNRTIMDEWNHDRSVDDSYITIEDELPEAISGVVFNHYTETPEVLRVVESVIGCEKYHSALLRSLCRITSQPDSGDVYIHIEGEKTVDPISLLEYIVSFRDENHFHEEICEAIYKRLWDILKPVKLVVKCLYARRGGWDINPERASDRELLHNNLKNSTSLHIKMPRQ
jgi:7-cyano-7-deazaguanine reductase